MVLFLVRLFRGAVVVPWMPLGLPLDVGARVRFTRLARRY